MGTTTAARAADQYCTFRLGDLTFGVDVSGVQEVLRHQPMTPVPRAPGVVTGLINLRGQIVVAVDLAARLGLPGRPHGQLPMNVVLRGRGEAVSLLVDDIGDVIDTAGLDLEPAPSNLPSTVGEVVSGVLARPDGILLVLDAERAVDVSAAPDTTGGTP